MVRSIILRFILNLLFFAGGGNGSGSDKAKEDSNAKVFNFIEKVLHAPSPFNCKLPVEIIRFNVAEMKAILASFILKLFFLQRSG